MNYSARSQIFDYLVTHDFEPEALDSRGQSVTDHEDAELISFDYRVQDSNYGVVVLVFPDENTLAVYYGDNLGRAMDSEHRGSWYDFLAALKNIAGRNLLNFQVNNINRLKYTMKGMSAIREGLFEGFQGRRRHSYSEQRDGVRIRIDHDRDIAEGQARHRAIDRIYIECDSGERFRVPSRSLLHARVLAQHAAQGGTPYDVFGQYINRMMQDLAVLSRFIRATNNGSYTGAADIVEAGRRHYHDMKAKAKSMLSRRGYQLAREQFDPASQDSQEQDLEHIRELFVRQDIDQRIQEALPILAAIQQPRMQEISEFEQWSHAVCESTWALPQSSEQLEQLANLMSQPLPVGADAANATEILYDLVGDDELFDRLSELAQQDPDADARDLVQQRLAELGIELPVTDTAVEDIDTSGILNQRTSNMSS